MAPPLSPDALIEILSRVSLRTLGGCRMMCRMSRDLTYESSFMRLNTKRAGTLSGYFLQSLDHGHGRHLHTFVSLEPGGVMNIGLDFLPCTVGIMASAKNGLLLCKGAGGSYPPETKLFVCKPTTRECIRIPNPNQRFSGAGSFGLAVVGSVPLRFKVVRVVERRRSNSRKFDGFNSFNVQLFDSDKFKWKLLGTIKFPFCEFLYPGRPSLEAGMALHWLTDESKLLTFYCDTESWDITSLPSNLSDTTSIDLAEIQGRVGIIQRFWQKDFVDLWIMQATGGGEEKIWQKVRTVEMAGVKEQHGTFSTRSFYGSDMATLWSLNRLIFHNFKNKKNEVVKIGGHISPEVFFLQSDFEAAGFEEMQELRSKKKQEIFDEALDALGMFYGA